MTEPKKALETDVVHQFLPLVIEILPGQAAEGLITVYEPGSYENQPLRALCERMLNEKNVSIEGQQILEDIMSQLDGGRLICRGRGIDGSTLDHALFEETESGEKYLYLPVRAIKPQEGGSPPFREGRGPVCPPPRDPTPPAGETICGIS